MIEGLCENWLTVRDQLHRLGKWRSLKVDRHAESCHTMGIDFLLEFLVLSPPNADPNLSLSVFIAPF